MENNITHKNLAAERWFNLSLMEQLGNIGSEVGRAINWKKRGEKMHQEKALERALELFDLTIRDKRWVKRLKEITRSREIVCDFFYGDNFYQTSPEFLEKYFYYFAFAARKNR